ncbi:MAG TPA: nitrophenyl compound nitroreductase subunit ArsF family protein [Phycisphaerae bacterium]|nr:nitrophenyl compound nitroreductase subunit ArsF family protein [Phycisphaerae bacterium]HPS53452.1 nitrophenyl compound nitroreductase subunit ArsF family protein [Phycisphaerae bacterium]
MKTKKIISKLLMAFVFISIGFAAGREFTKARMQSQGDITAITSPNADKVVVYYMHASFRCFTCNLVESIGKEIVTKDFADAVKAGRLEWKSVDFQENEKLAQKYNVGGNMIIVVKFRDGREVDVKRLDKVMALANNRSEFVDYVRPIIQEMLGDKS